MLLKKKNLFFLGVYTFLIFPVVLFTIIGFYVVFKNENKLNIEIPSISKDYYTYRELVRKYKEVKKTLKTKEEPLLKTVFLYNPFVEKKPSETNVSKPQKVLHTPKKYREKHFYIKMVFKLDEKGENFCVINDKIYKNGDKVFKDLKIEKIGEYYVEFVRGTQRFKIEVGSSFIYKY